MRCDLLVEVALVVDDPGDDEAAPGPRGDLDGGRGALVGVDPAEEQEVVTGAGAEREGISVDAMVDRGRVVQCRLAIGVADRHVGRRRVVPLVDGQDPRRGEAVDGGDDGRVDERAVGQREEVEAVVDDVEVAGVLEDVGDVLRFGDLRLDPIVLVPSMWTRARAWPW